MAAMTTTIMPTQRTAKTYAQAARYCYLNALYAHARNRRRRTAQNAAEVAEWASAASDRARQAARMGYLYLG